MKKILVIEDESLTRNIFLESLKTEGFQTISADNGLVGVQQAQEQLPDLVVCDIRLPELDGYDVLTILRQNPTTAITPFIFLTAKTTKAEVRQGMESGADDYLTKPTTVEELLGAIAAQLEKQAILQHRYATHRQPEPAPTDTPIPTQSIFPSIQQLREVFDFIEANYRQPITLNDVAQAVGYSPTYLTNIVGSRTGRTVRRWIVERRMVEVRSLLRQTNWSMEQIASVVGYQNTCHFFRQFRQYHGTSPQVWRRSVGQTALSTR